MKGIPFTNSKELLILFDAAFSIKYASDSSRDILQYAPHELLDVKLTDLLPLHEQQKISSTTDRVSKGMIYLYLSLYTSLQLRSRSGELLPVEGYLDLYYDERGYFMYGIARLGENTSRATEKARQESLSELKAEHSALIQRKQLLETIYNYLPDAVMVLDTSRQQLIDFNEQSLQLFEVEHKEIFARAFSFSSITEQEEALHFLQQPAVPTPVTRELQYLTLQGRTFTGKTYLMDFTYGSMQVRIVQISDISQQKALEEKLRSDRHTAEQAIKSKEDFLSTMSHEIRTPLNALLGMTHLMLQRAPREDQKKLLETLKFAGENLTSLINDILDYSKIEAGKLELNLKDFNLKEFIQGIKLTYKNLANEKGLIFRLLLEEEVPAYIHGDMNRLGQILNNLLNNAIKFTEKGQVVVSICVEEERPEEYVLLFEVADTGIGIPADRQEIIFDPYRQASSQTAVRFGGTGLGLSIVRNLVNLQKGRLLLQSKEGEGSTFKVILPFGKPENPEHHTENSNTFMLEYQSLEGLKVLYVEDVIPNQLLMEGLCDHWNVDLDTALNGLEALEKVKQNHYDLILMDIQMPVKDGYSTALEIRNLKDAHYENVPIIALSASVSDKTQQKILASGMNDYLPKPINPKNLHEKLSKFSKAVPRVVAAGAETEKEKEESVAYATDTPDFSQLHALYMQDTAGYTEILRQIRKLTVDSIAPVLHSFNNYDEINFRFTCHKLMSYIRLINLVRLEELIEDAKDHLKHNTNTLVHHQIGQELEHHFHNFVGRLDEELKKYQGSA